MSAWVPHTGSYQRRMPVSLARMYENALDWEHLPWLHSSSFSSIHCIENGDWGWRAKATLADTDKRLLAPTSVWKQSLIKSLRHQPLQLLRFSGSLLRQMAAAKRGNASVLLELRLDRSRKRWITKTLAGVGAGTEIWTHVIEHGPEDIEVVVDFYVPNIPQAMAAPLAHYYKALYQRLYDEDQGMMQTRQHALNRVKPKGAKLQSLALGPVAALEKELPKLINFNGREWRLLKHRGQFAIHATLCPHMLGPLADARITDEGAISCPWHGYQFALNSGQNLSGQRCRLPKPPAINIENNQLFIGP